jgi:hypothetical protein
MMGITSKSLIEISLFQAGKMKSLEFDLTQMARLFYPSNRPHWDRHLIVMKTSVCSGAFSAPHSKEGKGAERGRRSTCVRNTTP